MDAKAWLTLGLVGLMLGLLATSRWRPVWVLWGGLSLLLALGILPAEEALAGLANPGVVTIGALLVVAAALQETGGLDEAMRFVLGRTRSIPEAQGRLMSFTAGLSAFVNNTPLVALLLPLVSEWARKMRIPPSQLMIPLSYAAILGGTCTLIGTSTNLVVQGLLLKAGLPGLGFFEIAWVGLPCCLAGIAYVVLLGRWLLPNRQPPVSPLDDPREYTVEMMVEPGSPLVGRTIEEAGLRHLPGLYLMEVDRNGQVLPAVSPKERLQANDRLIFVGIVESVVDLQRIRGLKPATDQVFKLDSPRSERCLIEAVVSDSCPLVGRTIREGRFRTLYNAVVIAVARNGERLRSKIGDIVLRPGDTLLLEAHPSFVDQQRNSRDFFLVSRLEEAPFPRHERAWLALATLGGMAGATALGWLDLLQASLLAAGLMVFTGCCSPLTVRRKVDWEVLLTVAAALGVGEALEKTGVAQALASSLLQSVGHHPLGALAVVYGATVLLTELVTNNAAAAMIFPMALATAQALQVSPLPFAVAIMMAASASFSTPIGYQTNLMVYGPGGYRFTDYLRIGVPLQLLLALLAWTIIPRRWPF